jgi:hypothetical protein
VLHQSQPTCLQAFGKYKSCDNSQLQNITMTKDDIVATFMKMSEIRDQLSAIGEIISALSGMHLYILFVSLS